MNSESKRILLLEDEPPVRLLVEEILTGAGYSVSSCARGMEMFNAVRKQSPDLVIVDLTVPGLDGIQVITMLRRSGSYNGPILVLSGRIREDDIQSALDAGAQEFLSKPVRRDKLVETVARLLNPEPESTATETTGPDAR